MEDLNTAIVLTLLLAAVWVAAPPVVAARKGYAPGPWFCAVGLVGVAVLAAFPRLGAGEPPAQRSRLRSLADRVGYCLSAAGLAGWMALCLLGIAARGDR